MNLWLVSGDLNRHFFRSGTPDSLPELVQVPMGAVDRIELIGSVQFHLPVVRANAELAPGEVIFQPHHVGADGSVNRRLIRLASEGRIVLSGPITSSEAEAAAIRHQLNVERYYRNQRAAEVRRMCGTGSATTSPSTSADEFARMVGSSSQGRLPLSYQGNSILHWRTIADGRLGSPSMDSSPESVRVSVGCFELPNFFSFLVVFGRCPM